MKSFPDLLLNKTLIAYPEWNLSFDSKCHRFEYATIEPEGAYSVRDRAVIELRIRRWGILDQNWRTLRDSNPRPIGSKPTTLSS